MEDWKVLNNYIYDNNLPNGAPGGLPALLPPGGGILLMGVSDNILAGNRIEDNGFFGLAVIDFCLSNPRPDLFSCEDWNTSGEDPVPRNNLIAGNVFVNNGTDVPDPEYPLAPLAADIIEAVLDLDPPAGNSYHGNRCTTYSFPGPGWVEQVPAPCPSPSSR
jgi:hypothetical protein